MHILAHGIYHHYHVDAEKDTMFCKNENHDEPVENDNPEGSGWVLTFFLLIIIFIALFLFIGCTY